MTTHIAINLLQALVVLLFAPMAKGVLNRPKERLQSKRCPHLLQLYYDLWRLFHKDEVVSEQSSWVFRVAPCLAFIAPLLVTLLIPMLTAYPLFMAFMVGAGFILALGPVVAALGGAEALVPFFAPQSLPANFIAEFQTLARSSARVGCQDRGWC